jgi:hypothetical protein
LFSIVSISEITLEQTIDDFFHDFLQGALANAEANSTYQLESFMLEVSSELIETGFIEGFEYCHFRAVRGMRVDGYWFSEEDTLDLFVADFDSRRELASLTRTDSDSIFKRLSNFFEAALKRTIQPDVTTPEYGLVRQIADRRASIRKVNFFLFSERVLSDRVQALPDNTFDSIPVSYHIWDVSRLYRQKISRGHKEALDIDFVKTFGVGVPCLPANLGSEKYQSFLMVMPAAMIAGLYEQYSARLLEQNVRTFLQARGQVNKGIRLTIMNEPWMFFAYNNGITATAQNVETRSGQNGLEIVRITDLQIVNGGQTTASLFHTQRRDKADLSQIFVQMKLSVISASDSDHVVPKISEYANTQNRVNAADFFSNHPFHVRMAEFSRRIWAPARQGEQRETKWFYERARGQYADAQSNNTASEQRAFLAEYPKQQMFTKTDLAKFENVFDEHPRWVNNGSQRNFAEYAKRIGKEWEKNSDSFNEFYYRRAISRGIVFRATEKLVMKQPWYNGGYRANIVAYTLSTIGKIAENRKRTLDYNRIWQTQSIDAILENAIETVAEAVHEVITHPPQGVANVTEWCKRESCWNVLLGKLPGIERSLDSNFLGSLIAVAVQKEEASSALKNQIIDNEIELQSKIITITKEVWSTIMREGKARGVLSEKEIGILVSAHSMGAKRIPTTAQCALLADIYNKAYQEGIVKIELSMIKK